MRLEKIVDFNMHLFTEKGLRGGTSYRYAKANNKYMEDYDPRKISKFITYIYMNSLCGCAMSGYLPYGRFNWLKNVNNFDLNSVSEKSLVGYILEADIEYPKELHVLHNDYPLAP